MCVNRTVANFAASMSNLFLLRPQYNFVVSGDVALPFTGRIGIRPLRFLSRRRLWRRKQREEIFFLASRQGEVHRNLRLHLDRFAVQDVRPIAPLAHGIESRFHKHGMSTDNLQVLDATGLADDRPQHD